MALGSLLVGSCGFSEKDQNCKCDLPFSFVLDCCAVFFRLSGGEVITLEFLLKGGAATGSVWASPPGVDYLYDLAGKVTQVND